MKCIYCREEKADSEFSLEHIIPQSIGGEFVRNLATKEFNIFTTNHVCKKCNNDLGCMVDNACIRSVFIYEAREKASNIEGGHLCYMGNIEVLSKSSEICELYYLDGVYIFCFYPAKQGYESHIGGFPIYRSKGRLCVAVLYQSNQAKSTNISTLNAFKKRFKKHRRYAINVENREDFFSSADEQAQAYIDKCKSIIGKPVKTVFTSDKLNARRLYYKIALGIGYNLFGWSFLDSDNAKELYKGLSMQENETRGADYLMGEYIPHNDLTVFDSACSLSLTRIGMQLGLQMSIYGKTFYLLLCSDVSLYGKPTEWLQQGITYVWDKERKLRTGPHNDGELAAHRIGLREIPTLTEIAPSSYACLNA